MSEVLTREQLYELVWQEPMVVVAKRFSLSDVGLKKICAKADIPVPPRGHWAKLEARKRIFQPALPPRPPGMAADITVGKSEPYNWQRTQEELLGPLSPPPTFDEPIDTVRERVRKQIGRVRVPRDLSDQHAAIARLLREDQERVTKQNASSLIYSWEKPLFDNPEARRRLRILNGLFLAVARAGARGYFGDKAALEPGVAVYDHHIRLKLEAIQEQRRKTNSPPAPRRKRPKLRLSILNGFSDQGGRYWDDGDTLLESRIAEIAVEVIVAAEESHRAQCQRMFYWRVERKRELEEELRRQQIEAERKELERQVRLAQERIDRLLAQAAAFTNANAIRAFVASVCSQAVTAHVDPHTLDAWRIWALQQADQLDPVASGSCWAEVTQR